MRRFIRCRMPTKQCLPTVHVKDNNVLESKTKLIISTSLYDLIESSLQGLVSDSSIYQSY